MAPKEEKLALVFVINGEDFVVEVNSHEPLKAAVAKALAKSNNTGRPPEEWEVRDAGGVLLERDRSIRDLGLANGARLFLSLRVGAGGHDQSRARG